MCHGGTQKLKYNHYNGEKTKQMGLGKNMEFSVVFEK